MLWAIYRERYGATFIVHNFTLQRNRLIHIDFGQLLSWYPDLRVVDLREQRDAECVTSLSPPPPSLEVKGESVCLFVCLFGRIFCLTDWLHVVASGDSSIWIGSSFNKAPLSLNL